MKEEFTSVTLLRQRATQFWSGLHAKPKLEKKENSSLQISKYQVKSEGVGFCGALGSSRSNELFITYLLFQIM